MPHSSVMINDLAWPKWTFWWLHERCFKRATCTRTRNEWFDEESAEVDDK